MVNTKIAEDQGPVVQNVVSLTSSLVVKMLSVLVSTVSNSQLFLLKKNVSSLQKLLTFFFSKNTSVNSIFNDQNFNDTLTNETVSFEQLCPENEINEY